MRLSREALNIEVINLCLDAAVRTVGIRGPVVEVGSRYTPGWEICDRRRFFSGLEFIGCDIREGLGVDRVEDIMALSLASGSAGTMLVLETIEHVRDPWRALSEVHRVLGNGGTLLMSVPFSYRLHGFPADYWRFTASGVHAMLDPFPSKAVVSLGAAVKPQTIFAVATKDRTDLSGFREAVRRQPLWWRLALCGMQERARDCVGALLGRADFGSDLFAPETDAAPRQSTRTTT